MNDPNQHGWPPPPQQQPWPQPNAQPQQQPWPQPNAQPQQAWPQAQVQPQQPWPQAQVQPQQPWPQPHVQPQQPWPQPQQPWPQPGAAPYPGYAHPHAPGFAAYPPGAFARPQYEFSAEENAILDDLATWCGGLAILKFVGAGLSFVGRNMLSGAIELAVALTLWGGRKSLRAVVQTQGNDVTHLMAAVDKLATVFQIRLVLALIGAIAIAIVFAIFVALAVAAPEQLDEIMRDL